ncbi:MAG: twin-arginine translocase TatA/TatE family subunit [Candidatus Cryptobacteroides sp.]|nr:twin-arginine translocase TatA/TatE family subunit [Bacteroidales bacterium]MDD7133946.1 twin-arginine translocase TatA/TatE family subunit [Bacteroidales bacterium]MDY2774140.1 twin-arginine translocase TatA/TatE family subunit [Candidatus Cryptobacteroides sp.]
MLTMLPLGVFGPWQVIIIALVIILLFGGRKIPELMRGLGHGMKSFKQGMKDADKEIQEIKKEIDTTPEETKDADKK